MQEPLRLECLYMPSEFYYPTCSFVHEIIGMGKKDSYVCWFLEMPWMRKGDWWDCLADFTDLANASDKQVHNFVEDWGLLLKEPPRLMDYMDEEREEWEDQETPIYGENIALYRQTATQFNSIFNVIEALHNGLNGSRQDWESATSAIDGGREELDHWWNSPAFDLNHRRGLISRILTKMMADAKITSVIRWDTPSPQLAFTSLKDRDKYLDQGVSSDMSPEEYLEYGCYGFLLMSLIGLLLVPPHHARCSICQKLINLKGRPGRKGRNYTCTKEECKKQDNRNRNAASKRKTRHAKANEVVYEGEETGSEAAM